MDESGLWELFCKTGLPEAFLALAGSRGEQGTPPVSGAVRPSGPGGPNTLRDV
ncbi:MAG: hypothetical protein ACOX7A_01890 [Lawsonibacter sp.]